MLTAMRTRLAQEHGVSLIELLVVVLLMSVVGGAMTRGLVGGMRATTSTQSRFDALAALQQSVNRMTRELRAADPLVRPPSDGNTAVVEVYRDATFSTRLRHTYTYCPVQEHIAVRTETNPSTAASALVCGAPGNSVFMDQVTNGPSPVFAYQRADGTTAGPADKVFRIVVTVKRAVAGAPADDISVETVVRLRNER